MHAGLGGRCANMAGLGISQCAALIGRPQPKPNLPWAAFDTKQDYIPTSGTPWVFTNDNRTVAPPSSASYTTTKGSLYKSSGLLYCEFLIATGSSANEIGLERYGRACAYNGAIFPSNTADGYSYRGRGGPTKGHLNTYPAYGAAWGGGNRISMLWNAWLGLLGFWKDGVDQGIAFTDVLGFFTFYSCAYSTEGNATVFVGGPASPFLYTPPPGYTGWRR